MTAVLLLKSDFLGHIFRKQSISAPLSLQGYAPHSHPIVDAATTNNHDNSLDDDIT